MRDTRSEAADVQIAAFRRLSPAERVAMAFEASEWLLTISRARSQAAPRPSTTAVGSADGRSPVVPDADV